MIEMQRLIALLALLSAFVAGVYPQSPQEIADKIRTQEDRYKWGEGRGYTEKEAKNAAISSLMDKFKLNVGINKNSKVGYDNMTGGEESYSTSMSINSFMSLPNTETLYWDESTADGGTMVRAFIYVSNEDIEEAARQRREKIADMVLCGIEQEMTMNIAGALRYYNWALTMAQAYKDNVKVKVNDSEKNVSVWLPQKIESMLRAIDLSFDENSLVENCLEGADDKEKYTVIGKVAYDGRPVMGIDFSYFNGERLVRSHAKDGEVILNYTALPADNKIAMKVEYEYADEASKSYDDEIATAMKDGSAFTNSAAAQLSIPIKVKKDKIEKVKVGKSRNELATAAVEESLYEEPRETIERTYSSDEKFINDMKAVENALRSRDYASVKDLFTEDGYSRFRRMVGTGTIKVTGKPVFSVETSPLFTIGKSIPVSVTQGKHVSKEKIVFRFDKVSGLISSVAYGLTKRAEDDIFRKASWNIDSRYSLLTFMEDYQTAFILQDIAYIERIFSNNAIIIVGKYEDAGGVTRHKGFVDGKFLSIRAPKMNYTRYDKDTYIDNLKALFRRNSWTHISFEENDIEKINTGTLLDNEALWIEIRQNWSVASGYNDTGYLALQINLKPSGSRINVRTFTPEFIPINQLKQHFPIGMGSE